MKLIIFHVNREEHAINPNIIQYACKGYSVGTVLHLMDGSEMHVDEKFSEVVARINNNQPHDINKLARRIRNLERNTNQGEI
ncbi:MAG: hypothetical protein CMC82_01800 [Flavobacteriaceae bacterium]|nr:hypothetical protein [Flavobacteriaceae bacterium]